jgi:hypothetical protein
MVVMGRAPRRKRGRGVPVRGKHNLARFYVERVPQQNDMLEVARGRVCRQADQAFLLLKKKKRRGKRRKKKNLTKIGQLRKGGVLNRESVQGLWERLSWTGPGASTPTEKKE